MPRLRIATGPAATLYTVSFLAAHLEHPDPRLFTLLDKPSLASRLAVRARGEQSLVQPGTLPRRGRLQRAGRAAEDEPGG